MKIFSGIILMSLILTGCTTAENLVIRENQKLVSTKIIPPIETTENISITAFNSYGDLYRVMFLPDLKGFTATNSPNPVQLKQITKLDGYPYSWIYETSIKSTRKLKIVEFGAFNYVNNEWILGDFTRKLFTSVDFIN